MLSATLIHKILDDDLLYITDYKLKRTEKGFPNEASSGQLYSYPPV